MSELMRLYKSEECGKDGYPPQWHERIKHEVRVLAGDRCVRCLHPYKSGTGEWSPCDEDCKHTGRVRYGPLGREFDAGDKPAGILSAFAHSKPVEAHWRILTVHHLTGCWGHTTEAKRDCRWWNLAPLCQVCHLVIQGKVHMERAFIFEHSDWFKPYAAGWYAWKYEGREITREEAEADLDRLLALERLA